MTRSWRSRKRKKPGAFGLEIVPLSDDELWRLAAEIKAEHALSLADDVMRRPTCETSLSLEHSSSAPVAVGGRWSG
jgi:hypothetical protein